MDRQTPDGPIPGYIPVFDGYPVFWSTCHLSLQVFIAQLCLFYLQSFFCLSFSFRVVLFVEQLGFLIVFVNFVGFDG
jgi:hypothetical protein